MITFIVNPIAGSGHALKVEETLKDALEARGIAYEMLHTQRPGHATELAREAARHAACEAVVAVGGDGTAFEVACGLMSTGIPLGIIPAGTGNDFVKTTGTPRQPLAALEAILHGKPRPVDLCSLNDRLFLNVCGTGFDVTVLDNTLAAKRYARGITPYLIGLVRAIFHYRPVHVRLTVDGVASEADVLLCSVANGRYIGGGIPVCPAARIDDGKLDLVLADIVPRWKIPLYLPGLMLGRILRFGIAHHQLCERVEIRSPGMRLNVDGEIFSMDDAVFSVQPGKLMLYW